jgi:hypothetical protein
LLNNDEIVFFVIPELY